MKKRGIILDFDGLIVDTEMVWFNIYSEWLLSKYNYKLTKKEFVICVGSNSKILFEEISKKIKQNISYDEFLSECHPIFIANTSVTSFMPDVLKFVTDAKDYGYKIGIATSSNRAHVERLLKDTIFLDHMDFLVTRDDVTQAKPSPELFNLAHEKMGLKKSELVIFEDSKNGYLAANHADIDVIIVPNEITVHSDFGTEAVLIDKISEFRLYNLNV